MSYQHQKKKISNKGNTHYRTWKKGKSWCYSFSLLAALAGGVVLASQTVNADTADIATTAAITTETTESAETSPVGDSAETPAPTVTDNNAGKEEAAVIATSQETDAGEMPAVLETTPEAETAAAIPSAAAEFQAAPTSTFSALAAIPTTAIQDLQVTFTDQKGNPLQDGSPLPKDAIVGANISFSLDTTGYKAGDSITIDRSQVVNGEAGASGENAVSSFDVTDPNSGEVVGSFSAVNRGGVVFTLTQAGIDAGKIDVKSASFPRVFGAAYYATDTDYQLTLGNSSISLTAKGENFPVISPSDVSTDGDHQGGSSVDDKTAQFSVNNSYAGHVSQQNEPSQYTNATGGIITNLTPGNDIVGIAIGAGDSRQVSFWSNGVLHTANRIGRVGDTGYMATSYLSGIDNTRLKDASSKLTKDMDIKEAEAALSPGEWGAVDRGDGSWLWAYKTGDPSEGTIFDGEGFVAALQASGVEMTEEDIAKTLAQTQFIANTTDYVKVTFDKNTIPGEVMNTMDKGSATASNILPSSDSEVPGRIIISYYDDTTGTDTPALLTLDTDSGTTGDQSSYSTADQIAYYESLGYVLVKDTYSEQAVTFGGLGSMDPFEVHFVHGTKAAEPNTKTVNETIHYVNKDDGSQIAPDKTQTVTFTQTGTIDLVKEKAGDSDATTWDEWAPASNSFAAVDSPEIENYTADQESIPEVTDLTSNSEDQEFTVYYTAKTEAVTETKDVTETIHYVYEDGTEAAADHTDTVTFSRPATKNLATGVVTPDGDGHWTAENDDTRFDAVTSPAIDGYTADKLSVEEVTGLTAASENTEETVTYTKNSEAPVPDDDTKDTPAPEPTDTTPTPKTTINLQPVSQPAKKAVLPSTGDEERSIAVAAGGLVILGAGLLGVIRHLRRKKQ
ncbi:hypothetical protein OfM2_02370 [Lactovum odontotermitis]